MTYPNATTESGRAAGEGRTVATSLDARWAPSARTGKPKRPRFETVRVWLAVPFFTAAACATACAASQPPTDRMTSAQAAVRAAHDVGAQKVPEAQLHVRLAEEQIRKARSLIDNGDNSRADLILQRANADAELGLALAREEATRDQAQRVLEQTRGLQIREQ